MKKGNFKRLQELKSVVAGQYKVVYSIVKSINGWKIKCTFYSNNDIKLQRLKWADYVTYEEAKNALESIRTSHL